MPLHTSTYISAGGHAALLGFALVGGLFTAEPLEFPTVNVSTISAEDFAALSPPLQPVPVEPPPELVQDVPTLSVPEPEDETVLAPVPEADPVPTPAPEPQVLAPPQPPEPEPIPDTAPPVPPAPEPPAEEAVTIPDVAPDATQRPVPRPADRVASEAVAEPDPTVEIDNTAQEATTPDAAAETPVPEQDEAAPEEAATEIVTEAETPNSSALSASAPSASTRPRPRPQARTAQTAAAAPAPDDNATQDAVNAALAEALGGALGEAASDQGASLSEGEVGGFRLAVQGCWDVDVGSPSADVTVVVVMAMNRDGTVVPGSIVLQSATGGEGRAVDTAFLRARRAIFECQREGYDLPDDRYDLWEQIEITFNPRDMRIR